MTKLEKVLQGLQHCQRNSCNSCPYANDDGDSPYKTCRQIEMLGDALELLKEQDGEDKDVPTNPAKLMAALYDVRDRWIARLPKSEWYRDKKAQGVEQGIEMCIKRMSEVLYGNE